MILLDYLPWLLGTLMLEIALVAALAPHALRRRSMLVAAAVNLCTHPLATLLQRFGWSDLLSLELLVAAAETLAYWRLVPLTAVRATVLSVLANLVSATAGMLLWAIMAR